MNTHNVDERIIQATENFVRERLGTESTGHDWWHMVRVRNIARSIHDQEGGNWYEIQLAVLLHDVGDRKVIDKDEDDYTIAESFMRAQQVDAQTVDNVMSIITHMSFSKSLASRQENPSKEFAIVQDADRLDAIGAIGIARAFAFGGSKKRMLYDPDASAFHAKTTQEYRSHQGSTFHHFEEKLLLIKDLLNTDTAKTIAAERDAFMRQYLAQFIDEWDGRK